MLTINRRRQWKHLSFYTVVKDYYLARVSTEVSPAFLLLDFGSTPRKRFDSEVAGMILVLVHIQKVFRDSVSLFRNGAGQT